MGYSQTTAFTRSPESSVPVELSRPVDTTSPIGGTHYIEEEFGWHTCQHDLSNPVTVAFRFGPDSWLSLDNSTHGLDVTPQKPDSVSMPLPGRVNELAHPHAQTAFACSAVSASFIHQESGFGYPK